MREVLDVGAGSGVFSKQLIDAHTCARAVCVDPAYAVERRETYAGAALEFVQRADNVCPQLILMMDVLEHVDDDVALLREYAAHLADGGKVFNRWARAGRVD